MIPNNYATAPLPSLHYSENNNANNNNSNNNNNNNNNSSATANQSKPKQAPSTTKVYSASTTLSTPKDYFDDHSLSSYKWGPAPTTPIQSPHISSNMSSPISLPPIRMMGFDNHSRSSIGGNSNINQHHHLPPLTVPNMEPGSYYNAPPTTTSVSTPSNSVGSFTPSTPHHHHHYFRQLSCSPRSPATTLLPLPHARLPPPPPPPPPPVATGGGAPIAVPVNPPPPPPPPVGGSPTSMGRPKVGLGIYPAEQQPILAAGKDIKRRTKTGCLTCRKRRIKCDEKHPTCSNCDKSKRICLGYDPVFRITADRRRTRKQGVVKKPTTPTPAPSPVNVAPTSSSSRNNRMKINSLLDAAAVLDNDKKEEPKSPPVVRWASWSQLCQYYSDHVGPHLNNMFHTDRFTEITLSSSNTSGQELAILEAVRQIVTNLCPSFYLGDLTVDETKMPKLEELRISNDYKLLRCVFQLLGSNCQEDVEFLPVAESDSELFNRILATHKFIHGQFRPTIGDLSYNSKDIDAAIASKHGQTIWPLLESLTIINSPNCNSCSGNSSTAMNLTNDQIDSLLDLANQDILKIPILLALHYVLTDSPTQSKIRYRLVDLSSNGLDLISQRLVHLILYTNC